MAKIFRRGVFLLIVTLLMTILNSGCWSRREIDKLAFVGSVAIDQAEDPELLEVTVQVILPGALAGGGGQTGMGGGGGGASAGTNKVWLVSEKGPTVFEAVKKINDMSANHLFFGHLTSVIIGEKLARNGVKDVLDNFDRMSELRRNIWILIAPGRAKDILEARPKLQGVPSLAIEGLFIHQTDTSFSYPSSLNNFLIMLSSRSTDPVAARITTIPVGHITPGEPPWEAGRKEIKLEGAAIFEQDKLVDWLDGRETRGVLWAQKKFKYGTITFPNPRGNHKFMTFEVYGARRKIHTFMEDGELFVNLDISCKGNMVEQDSNADILSQDLFIEKENFRAFEAGIASQVKQEILAAMDKAREHKTDILGIGERFYIEHPQEFKKLQADWPEIFTNANVNVVVNVKVRRTGLINRSINAQKIEKEAK